MYAFLILELLIIVQVLIEVSISCLVNFPEEQRLYYYEGSFVSVNCTVCLGYAHVWFLNKTNIFFAPQAYNITRHSFPLNSEGWTEELTVLFYEGLNNTEIICASLSEGQSILSNISAPVTVVLEGLLHSPQDLHLFNSTTSVTAIWDPPFSFLSIPYYSVLLNISGSIIETLKVKNSNFTKPFSRLKEFCCYGCEITLSVSAVTPIGESPSISKSLVVPVQDYCVDNIVTSVFVTVPENSDSNFVTVVSTISVIIGVLFAASFIILILFLCARSKRIKCHCNSNPPVYVMENNSCYEVTVKCNEAYEQRPHMYEEIQPPQRKASSVNNSFENT